LLESSPLTLSLLQVAAILLVARVLGGVTRWLGQPLVVAEVLAGIVLGPSLLGWLWPDAMAALFPSPSLSSLKMLSQVGLVLFMFLIGLEIDPKLLKGRTRSSIAISQTSILVPFALGAGAAWWLHDTYSSPDVPLGSFLLFLGAAMSVTAFPVLARILSERHLLTSRVGAITIACAAVDNVTTWCVLAFVVAAARSQGMGHAIWTTGCAIGFVLAMLFLARPFLRRLASRVASVTALTPATVAIILLLLLLSSTAAELIGIHALFGAFLFGAILPKEGTLAEALADRIETVVVVLLLPVFFAYSGLRTEIGLISEPREWIVTGCLILLATAGKFGGSTLAARFTGLRWREASAIGILMNTRGPMELVVLHVGMDLGAISPTMFTMLVIMSLVTTFATTPLLRWFYPERESARDRLIEPAEPTAYEPPPFTVMMCISDATVGPAMATVAASLMGSRDEPASLFALHLEHPTDRPSVEFRRSDKDKRAGPLAQFLTQTRQLMLDVRPIGFVSAEPAVDIRRTAEAKQASLLLLGAHKPLLLEGQLSGTVRDVVAGSPCPVGVVVDRGLKRIGRVLVAYAGGSEDLAALELARRICQTPGTTMTLFHVLPPGDHDRHGTERAQIAAAFQGSLRFQQCSRSKSTLDTVGRDFVDLGVSSGVVHVQIVEHPSPPDAILEESRRGYDLIVLGMHARWGLGTSSISLRRRRVLAEAPVSILAVHPRPNAKVPGAVHEADVTRFACSASTVG
jgi:Kef-type K+ transport system membrane component KefB/nucleotide-binding universal stress UspA family protein